MACLSHRTRVCLLCLGCTICILTGFHTIRIGHPIYFSVVPYARQTCQSSSCTFWALSFLTVHCGVFVTPNLRLLVWGSISNGKSNTRFYATHISIGCPMDSKCAKVAHVPPFLGFECFLAACFGIFVISNVRLLAAIGVPLTMASMARTLLCFHATRIGQPNHFDRLPYTRKTRVGQPTK